MLAKSKLNRIEVLNSKTIIDSNTSHDVFVLINDVLNEYNKMKEEIKKFKVLIKFIEDFSLFTKQCYRTVWSTEKLQKVKIQQLQKQENGSKE